MKHLVLPTLLLAIAGCTAEPLLQDTRTATGSRTLAASSDYADLYALNHEAGTVSKITPATGAIEEVAVGVQPTRIARAGNQLFITLRGERAVVVMEDTPAGLMETGRIAVGCEPYAVVATEDGSRLWVSLSQHDQVVEIDPTSRMVVNTIDVGPDPRWMALHPDGSTVYVASARTPMVTAIPTNGEPPSEITVPVTTRLTDDGEYELAPRLTGDMAIDPSGRHLVVPAIYVDNQSQQEVPETVDPTFQYYFNPLPGLGRVNGAVIEVPIDNDGSLDARRADAIFLASFVDGENGQLETVRSYPNSVTVSPDGFQYAVSMEGSSSVAMVGALPYLRDVQPNNNTFGGFNAWVRPSAETDPVNYGFTDRPHAAIKTQAGPRGVVFTGDDNAFVHTFLQGTVHNLNVDDAMEELVRRGEAGLNNTETFTSTYRTAFDLTEFELPEDVATGRELFYSATSSMVGANSGVSCSTCHFEGRDDGLTWQLGPDVRQTPSLAGRVSQTHPVTWTNDVASVAAEAMLTSTIRMGGSNNTPAFEYEAVQAFVDYSPNVDHEARDGADPRIEEGRALFEREDVGCASCHSGVAYTDNRFHSMYGLESVNTPTLRGIVATAPYLHNGSAATLRDVLETSRTPGVMGDTSMLSETQMDALEVYLRSL